MWIVYTEVITDGGYERWFYGKYESRRKANEVASHQNDLFRNSDAFFCVANEDDRIIDTINNYRR